MIFWMKHLSRAFIILVLLSLSADAGQKMNPHTRKLDYCVTLEEEDGSPVNKRCKKIKVPNDSMSDNGDGTYSLTFGTAETDPIVGAVNGIIKADGAGNISAAAVDTDYLSPASVLDGEKITDDTIDDDSIDFVDVTLNDFTNDVGYVTQEYDTLDTVADRGATTDQDLQAGSFYTGIASPEGQFHSAVSNAYNFNYLDTYDNSNTTYPILYLRKSDTDTIGTKSQTDSGDALGGITWLGVDTGSNFDGGAIIKASQNGASGSTVPTDMVLNTYGSSGANTNQLVLYNNGNIGLNEAAPDNLLHLTSAGPTVQRLEFTNTASYGSIAFYEGTTYMGGWQVMGSAFGTSAWRNQLQFVGANNNLGEIAFLTKTGGSYEHRLLIENDGDIGIGTETPTTNLDLTITAIGDQFNYGDGLSLNNTTAATQYVDQASPYLSFYSRGWKTDATASARATSSAIYQQPEQGAASPKGVVKLIYGTGTSIPNSSNEIVRWTWGADAGALGSVFNELGLSNYNFRVEGDSGVDIISSDGSLLQFGGDVDFVNSGAGLPFAEISYHGAGFDTALAAQDTWYQVLGFDTDGSSNLATPDHTNDHITIVKTGVYQISYSMSSRSAASNAYEFRVWKNNGAASFTNTCVHRHTTVAGKLSAPSTLALISLTAGDTIELWIERSDGGAVSKTITIETIVLNLMQIGG